ncbi:hypothetical protein ACLKA7_007130 [Drosophila subpalustris]
MHQLSPELDLDLDLGHADMVIQHATHLNVATPPAVIISEHVVATVLGFAPPTGEEASTIDDVMSLGDDMISLQALVDLELMLELLHLVFVVCINHIATGAMFKCNLLRL